MENPDKFFENAENHFSPKTLEAIKQCVVISGNITTAEKDGNEIKLNAEQLKTAELALRGLNAAIAKIATDNPEVSGVSELTKDMNTISTHYSAMAQKLLPTLSSAPRSENNG